MERVRRADWVEDFLLCGKVKACFPKMKILMVFITYQDPFLSVFNHNDLCRPSYILLFPTPVPV